MPVSDVFDLVKVLELEGPILLDRRADVLAVTRVLDSFQLVDARHVSAIQENQSQSNRKIFFVPGRELRLLGAHLNCTNGGSTNKDLKKYSR